MAEIRNEATIPCKKGRKPLFDSKIKCVAGDPEKYIYEENRNVKESIRRRAILLGYSVTTFTDLTGGWIIKISYQ